MVIKTGLDRLKAKNFSPLQGKRVGLLCNQASIDHRFRHVIDIFREAHQQGQLQLTALFGPQHGIWGHTQDNMIEWEGGYREKKSGVVVFSLYGEHRKPTPEMLKFIDVLVIDLQDVGARYYTFIWTVALCMDACREAGVEVIVLDRPNPIGGLQVEGPLVDENFRSFVGWHSIPVRHGLTIGEIAKYLQDQFYPDCPLQVVEMKGWNREMYFGETGLPWAIPSPNMPLVETAVVYPGMCLLEATNISEGRGTTRPFEIFGAPWMDGWQMSEHLNSLKMSGVYFRPFQFQPTFNKYQDQLCEGCFIHITDRRKFKPFLMGISIISQIVKIYPQHFQWKPPPYEYEFEKLPFDILVGNSWLRKMIEQHKALSEMQERWEEESSEFLSLREKILVY